MLFPLVSVELYQSEFHQNQPDYNSIQSPLFFRREESFFLSRTLILFKKNLIDQETAKGFTVWVC